MDFRLTALIVVLSSQLSIISANEGLSPKYDTEQIRYLEYKVTNVLECNMTGIPPGSTDENYSIRWLKEDKVIELKKEEHPKYEFKGNKLLIHRTRDEDLGKYTCILVKGDKTDKNKWLARGDIQTYGIPTVKIISQGTFIEGQKISLECVVLGKPEPTIEWKFGNTTYGNDDARAQLLPNKNNLRNAILQIDEALMSDRGSYTCSAKNKASEFFNMTIEASTFVRVKDKLAALWPFIGICAEVVVLCAIIFIYERKRNKTELDESDTDQSPEQKNTPDHGKESVRQRK